ncbi:MAG: hypothetical protein IPK73_18645 [Candidatus Obscuribacter sp.]|nr:hypothetical protein [Candidatus Obscuribacter sp.]
MPPSTFGEEPVPKEVDDEIKQALRKDTTVKLVYRGSHHFKTESSLLNRLIVALMIKSGDVTLETGEYLRIEDNPTFKKDITADEFLVIVKDGERERGVSADRAIVRIGADPELKSICDQYDDAKNFWDNNYPNDKTFDPCYPPGFLLDDFMKYEWEAGYSVMFALGQSEDWDVKYVMQRPDRLDGALNLLGKNLGLGPIAKQIGTTPKDFDVKLVSSGLIKKSSFKVIHKGDLKTQNGHVAGPFISVRTASREILDLLLAGDGLPYHRLEYLVTEKAKRSHVEVHRNLETNVHLFDDRASSETLRIDSHKGMYQAHRLLRVRSILEIMQNKWLPHRYQRLGWQLGGKYEEERMKWRSVWQPPGQ